MLDIESVEIDMIALILSIIRPTTCRPTTSVLVKLRGLQCGLYLLDAKAEFLPASEYLTKLNILLVISITIV